MRRYPKISLGLLIILAIAAFFLISFILNKKVSASTFSVRAENNKFNLKFNLSQNDKNDLAKFLEKISLPATVQDGVTFEMDATGSAMLAYIAPIEGDINPSPNKLSVSGKLDYPVSTKDIGGESFRFPKDLNFAVTAPNLLTNASTYLNMPVQMKNAIEQNSANSLQTLAFFGQDIKGTYIFKTGNFDIEEFKNQSPESGIVYKEETTDSATFYLVNNFASFQLGDWTVMSSSLDAAKAVFNQQKEPANSIYFPVQNNSTSPTLALLFQNTQENPAPEALLTKIFGTKEKIPAFIGSIEKIDFAAKDMSFTASVIARDK